jgi:hypothetical protein
MKLVGGASLVIVLALLPLSVSCSDDPVFRLQVHNDLAYSVQLSAPCGGCSPPRFARPFITVSSGQMVSLQLYAPGEVGNYLVTRLDGRRVGCLRTVYDSIPKQRHVELSQATAPCSNG